MIILFAALVAKGAVFGAVVAVDAAGGAEEALLFERLFFVLEDGAWVEEKDDCVQGWDGEEKGDYDGSELVADGCVVEEGEGHDEGDDSVAEDFAD